MLFLDQQTQLWAQQHVKHAQLDIIVAIQLLNLNLAYLEPSILLKDKQFAKLVILVRIHYTKRQNATVHLLAIVFKM